MSEPVVQEILKLDPAKGDVIVLRLDKDYPMQNLWDQLDEIRERGVEVIAITSDIDVFTIKANGDYLMSIRESIPREHEERIRGEWEERFPDSQLALVSGLSVELAEEPALPESTDLLDTL